MLDALAVTAQLGESLAQRPLAAFATMFGAGLVTSLTPCIYPMIPITAGLLAGANEAGASRRRTVLLTLSYVGGVALFYAILGLIAGLTGTLFGTISSSPWAGSRDHINDTACHAAHAAVKRKAGCAADQSHVRQMLRVRTR